MIQIETFFFRFCGATHAEFQNDMSSRVNSSNVCSGCKVCVEDVQVFGERKYPSLETSRGGKRFSNFGASVFFFLCQICCWKKFVFAGCFLNCFKMMW